ncbi:MAG: class I SAM-dependent methyltransferase [Bacteroidales bacterium]|nr:class I SAM-dependent methyltransferase [Bacteroidales bacterium]
MKYLYPFLNPVEWIKAIKFQRKSSKFDKSAYDLELFLYSKILTNNMLHYGYFEDISVKPETISLKQLEDAQIRYGENIVEQIRDIHNPVLDVGCGLGGLAELMHNKNLDVEVLTPNKNQIDFINKNYPYLKSHNYKFEHFESGRKYGTIINSESLQYIPLSEAFKQAEKILLPDGKWIISDYFRLNDKGINKSSHLLEDFRQKLKEFNWRVIYERDITMNILPTLILINMYAERFLMPLKHFGYEKLRFKKPWLYYMTNRLRDSIDNKIIKEAAAINPSRFIDEKRYMFFVLEKT